MYAASLELFDNYNSPKYGKFRKIEKKRFLLRNNLQFI